MMILVRQTNLSLGAQMMGQTVLPISILCRLSMIVAAIFVLQLGAARVSADDWPQWRGPQRDGVWRETGIVQRFASEQLTPKWRTAIGTGYAGPAVANGKVYVTDRRKEKNTERVLCLEEATGKLLWKHEYPCKYRGVGYPAGPRCTPTVHDGKVYTVGTMGNLFCLDADDGTILWQKNYVQDYATDMPTWGIASAPLVDGRQLIALVGGKDNAAVVSFDKETGKEMWRALYSKELGYTPPVIFKAGGVRQLIIWVPEKVVSLDPKTGKTYWEKEFYSHTGLTVATPVFDGQRLLVSTFYNGPLMLRLADDKPAATELWRGISDSEIKTDKLHCLISTPVLDGDYVYGVGSYGELRCLDIKTGRRIWETYQATGHDRWWMAFLIQHEDRFFLPNEQGELIIAKLSPKGYEEISRAKLIEPTNKVRRRMVVWSHPAFANRCIYARNDKEILCVSLAARP